MLWNFVIDIINFIILSLGTVLAFLINVLPDSPFSYVSNAPVSKHMGTLNWIIPIPAIVSTLSAWLLAVVLYYLVMVVLRWVKAIE